MNVLVVWKDSIYEGGATELKKVLYCGLRLGGHNLKVVDSSNVLEAWLRVRNNLNWADVVVCGEFPATATTWPSCSKPIVWITESVPDLFCGLKDAPLLSIHRKVVKGNNRVHIVYPNRYLEMELDRFYGKFNYFLPFGVDWEYFSNGCRTKGKDFTILHVGYVGRLKGQLEALKACEELLGQIENLHLVFVGPKLCVGSGKTYWTRFKEAVQTSYLRSRINILGDVSKSRMKGLYYSSDVLLHSVGPYGGQLTPFEALSTGLPVVTSTRFLSEELVRPFGLVTDNYVGALKTIRDNWPIYHEMALEGKEWIRDNLSWKNYTDKFNRIIEEVVNEDRGF